MCLDVVDIQDIAHSLSQTCRYNGQCDNFYSTAEHSILISEWLWNETKDKNLSLAGLLHDAAEAYMGDIVRPMKYMFPQFKELEKRIDKVIFEQYNLEFPMDPRIKEADNRILNDERKFLFSRSKETWTTSDRIKGALNVEIECLRPLQAKSRFLHRFLNLYNEQRVEL